MLSAHMQIVIYGMIIYSNVSFLNSDVDLGVQETGRSCNEDQSCVNTSLHTLPAKNMEYLLFQGFFTFLWNFIEFLLSLCQFAVISVRVLYKDIVHNTIIYLPPILVWPTGD